MTREQLRSIADDDSWELIDKFINHCELNDFGIYWEIKKHSFLLSAIQKNNRSLVYSLIGIDRDLPGTTRSLSEAVIQDRADIFKILLDHVLEEGC